MKSSFIFWLLILAFICSSMFTVCKVDKTYAATFLKGKLEVTGFMRNDSDWRLRHGSGAQEGLEPGDLVMCRNTFQLEIEYKPTDWLTVFVMPRLVYEASLDFDRSLERRIVTYRRHDYKIDDDIREVYADITYKNLRARIGKQQIVWGEADMFRMADIVNPLDISWDNTLYSTISSYEDIRIPVWAFDFLWNSVGGHWWEVELLWIPGFIEDGFVPHKVAPEGANWALPGLSQFMVDSIRRSEPEDGLENSEFGLRVKGVFAGWETALFYFYSRTDHPVGRDDIMDRMMGGMTRYRGRDGVPALPGFYFHSGKYFEFPFTNRVGGTFNKYYDPLKTVFRGECVVTIDDPMSDTVATDRTYERETFQYMLGIDRPTSIPWLNNTRTFFISAQFFQKYILNHNDHMMDGSPGGTTTDSYQTVMSLLINTGYRWDTINPQIIFAYNFTGEGSINPQCEFVVGNNWRFGGGIQILMSHNQKEPYFGGIRHNDQIYVWAKYQFN